MVKDRINSRFKYTIHNHKIVDSVLVLMYKALFDIVYCIFIAGSRSYLFYSPSIILILNGWLFAILIAVTNSFLCEQYQCSSILLIALNLMYFIPASTICGYGTGSAGFLLCTIIYWLVLTFFQLKTPIFAIPELSKKEDITEKLYYITLVIVSVFSLFFWIKYTKFRIITDFLSVYRFRTEAAKYAIPSFLTYVRLACNTILPILLVVSMIKKKYIHTIWLLFLTLINFSFAGDKSVALLPIIIIGGYIIYKKERIWWFVPAGVIVELVGIVETRIGKGYIIDFIFGRLGALVALISDQYFRFFSNHPSDIFRQGIMGRLGFKSIYSLDISKVIGNNFNDQVISCNNGLLADVFSGTGTIGVFLMPIIIVFCLRLMDLAAQGVNPRFTVGIVLFYAICFCNTQWSTVLLSDGYIIACLAILIFPREKIEK